MFFIKNWKTKVSKAKQNESTHYATTQWEPFIPVYSWMLSKAHFSGHEEISQKPQL